MYDRSARSNKFRMAYGLMAFFITMMISIHTKMVLREYYFVGLIQEKKTAEQVP